MSAIARRRGRSASTSASASSCPSSARSSSLRSGCLSSICSSGTLNASAAYDILAQLEGLLGDICAENNGMCAIALEDEQNVHGEISEVAEAPECRCRRTGRNGGSRASRKEKRDARLGSRSARRWGGGRQSVPPHDLADPREIGVPTQGLGEDGCNLTEVV